MVAAGESELPPHRSLRGGDGGAEPRPPRAPKPRALTVAGKAQHHLLTSPAGSLLPLWLGRGGRVEGALGYESGEKCPRSCSAPSAQESDIPLLSPFFYASSAKSSSLPPASTLTSVPLLPLPRNGGVPLPDGADGLP